MLYFCYINAFTHSPVMCSSRPPIGYRHLVALVGFLTFFLLNVQRLSTSIAIASMVNYTSQEIIIQTNSSAFTVCPVTENSTSDSATRQVQGEFNWSSETQGYILGSYYCGWTAALFPTAKLAQIFQARRVALYSCILLSVSTLMAPVASRWNVYLMIAVQLLRGLGTGGKFTSFFVLMANWFPREERALLSTFVISGFSFGAIFTSLVSGWICDHPSLGWPVVFYVAGSLGLLHSILLATLLHETPQSCPRISTLELKYLAGNKDQVEMKKASRTPWYKILTSTPVYALMVGLFGYYWTVAYFWSVQSIFLGSVQHFSITKIGYFSALPFLLKAIGEYSTGLVCEWLTRKKYAGVNMLRKSCNTIGSVGFSISFLGIYYAGCNGYLSAGYSLLAMLFVGVSTPGSVITCMDMSPRFAGTLSGMLNTIGGSSSFLLPLIVGHLTKNQTLEEWHTVFFISIAIVMGCGMVFAIFGSAEVQSWNAVQNEIYVGISSVDSNMRYSASREEKTTNSLR